MDYLIDFPDSFEIIRDKIAQILTDEIANQVALGGQDIPVFLERTNPWELHKYEKDITNFINIWYDGTEYPEDLGTSLNRVIATATYNIDCYGYGWSRPSATGHIAGDRDAATNCHITLRVARHILMHVSNTYLGLRSLVSGREIAAIKVFMPPEKQNSVNQFIAGRLALTVTYAESVPEDSHNILCDIGVNVKTECPGGRLLASAEYNYCED